MTKEYLCTGCYRTPGTDGDANYCTECQTYKYFDWVEQEEDEPRPHQCNADLPTRYALRQEGRELEREHIVKLIERNICFDALADEDGRCSHHGGKCYELRQLVSSLTKGDING